MATPLVPGDILQMRLYVQLGDQVAINIRHWQVASITAGGVTDQEFADAFATLVGPTYKANLAVQAFFYGLDLNRLSPGPPTIPVNTHNGDGNGALGGDLMSKQTCGIITLRTATIGRAHRGRMYFPFPTEGVNTTQGTPSAPYVSALATTGQNFIGTQGVVGAGGTAVIRAVLFHRASGTVEPLVSLIPRGKWGTQRRRGDYGAANVLPF